MQEKPSSSTTPIFIGGLMKSGTTLLRKLISEHQHIFGGLETFWFSEEFTGQWKDSNSKRQEWLRRFFEVNLKDYEEIKAKASTPYQFLELFLNHCSARAKKNRWVEKTPDNILYLDLIWKEWPKAKVIHVIRNPLDVYASWKRNQKRSLDFFIKQLDRISTKVSTDTKGFEVNYFELHYEDLVNSTETSLKKVCSFLEEPFDTAMANYQGDHSAEYKKILGVTGKASSTAASISKPIFNSSINQWENILDSSEVKRITKEGDIYYKIFNLERHKT